MLSMLYYSQMVTFGSSKEMLSSIFEQEETAMSKGVALFDQSPTGTKS